MHVEAYPLNWPIGWPRCETPERSRYKVGYKTAYGDLTRELHRMGAVDITISSNVPLRLDGQPYADFTRRRMDDAGVAVYFTLDGKPQVVACDSWDLAKDNIRACGLTVEALRAIQRAGASELLERAFSGFKALPAAGESSPVVLEGPPPWQFVLQVPESCTSLGIAREAYRNLAAVHHPDAGGTDAEMAIINRAWEQAQAELG